MLTAAILREGLVSNESIPSNEPSLELQRIVAQAVEHVRPDEHASQSLWVGLSRQLEDVSLRNRLPNSVGTADFVVLLNQMKRQMTLRHSRPGVIDEALAKSQGAYLSALRQSWQSPETVFELITSMVDLQVQTRLLQRDLDGAALPAQGAGSATSLAAADDPFESLSAVELGKRLDDVSDETVYQREKQGQLFSVIRPTRRRGREYPAFQAWGGIAGKPLSSVMEALGPDRASLAFGFFSGQTDLLGGLTPVEALAGRTLFARAVGGEARAFLQSDPQGRLEAVCKAAAAHAGSTEAA